ncbi:MAG: hypothetical protein GXY43_03355 [Clostridiaceae bacterium]|nr:hypothetical protein [Clostridiaceae bacterium]
MMNNEEEEKTLSVNGDEEMTGQEWTEIEEQSDEEQEETTSDYAEHPILSTPEKKPIARPTVILSILCVALAVVLVLTQFGVIGTLRKAEQERADWFDSPEAAIRFFVESIRDGRFDAAVSSFAAIETAPKSNFSSQLDTVGSYFPVYQYNMPEQYPDYESLVLSIEQGRAASSTLQFASSILLGENYMKTASFPEDAQARKEQIDSIITVLNPVLLEKISVSRIDIVFADFQSTEEYTAHMSSHVNAYGYEGYLEYIALIQFNEQTFLAPFSMVSSAGKWKILQMTSGIMQIEYSSAIPISEEEYLNYI